MGGGVGRDVEGDRVPHGHEGGAADAAAARDDRASALEDGGGVERRRHVVPAAARKPRARRDAEPHRRRRRTRQVGGRASVRPCTLSRSSVTIGRTSRSAPRVQLNSIESNSCSSSAAAAAFVGASPRAVGAGAISEPERADDRQPSLGGLGTRSPPQRVPVREEARRSFNVSTTRAAVSSGRSHGSRRCVSMCPCPRKNGR